MFQRITLTELEECFRPIRARRECGVFFLRLAGYREDLDAFIRKFYEAAQDGGVVLEKQLVNPNGEQTAAFTQALGSGFELRAPFLKNALQKWVPSMREPCLSEFAAALCDQLSDMQKQGKSESILKNVYTKVLCWLSGSLKPVLPHLGEDNPPKILLESSSITAHELMILRILSSVGADILLLETRTDAAYLKLDGASAHSQLLQMEGMTAFPKDYSLPKPQSTPEGAQNSAPTSGSLGSTPVTSAVRTTPAPQPRGTVGATPAPQHVSPTPASRPVRTTPAAPQPRVPVSPTPIPRPVARHAAPPADIEVRFPPYSRAACTNAWMKKADWQQILTPPVVRGNDHSLFYNALVRVAGVQDRLIYVNELYMFYQNLLATGRRVCIIDGELTLPDPEEIQNIRRHNYRTAEEMIVDLAGNLQFPASVDLQRGMQLAFVRCMKQAMDSEPSIHRLTSTGVYLLCWIRRYQGQIFHDWKDSDIPCVIKMGSCSSPNEALYLLYLSMLPVDVLIIAPNLNQPCALQSEVLLEISGTDSLPLMPFPKQGGALKMQTVASHAEQDLTGLLYTDTGIYRNHQFSHADAIPLETTYDELFLLWKQELRYRPNFSTGAELVNMPVINAKISGVPGGKLNDYWLKVKQVAFGPETVLFRQFPIIQNTDGNPYQALAQRCIRNGHLRREELKASRQYPFGLLREEMQEHMLDKIQRMLDNRLVRGPFENGMEYTVLATLLNLRKDLVRLIQGFDFTKSNPKIVVISTRDQSPNPEDAILLTFLSGIGFDILQFVPTGYQTIERYLNGGRPVEHQVGEFLYDRPIPDLAALQEPGVFQKLNSILRGGN